MEEGNEQAMIFCKKSRLIKLIQEAEELMNDLDVTYEEIKADLDA